MIDGKRRTVRGVAAQVCPHCDAIFLGSAAVKAVDKALGLKRRRRAHAA